MKFLWLDKDNLLKNSAIDEANFYSYKLGEQIEVTTAKKSHKNSLLSKNLSSSVYEDKLMIKYRPSNVVYFSKGLLTSDSEDNLASFYIDNETGRCYVGTAEEFGVMRGVLMFSGSLALNNKVEEDRLVLGNSRVKDIIMQRACVLAVGLRDNKLFALYYLPSSRGISVSSLNEKNKATSTNTFKVRDCSSYNSFTINDWFDNTLVKEVHDE